jgi:Domain of unknown function (DUF4129)
MVSAAWLARAAWTGAGSGPGLAIGRHAARELARRELSKAIYHRGTHLTQRILGAIGRWLTRLFDGASGVVPGGWWALVGLAALAVIVVAAAAAWIGPVSARHRRQAGGLLPGTAVTARDLRMRAERLAAAGDFTGAVIESVRAIAAELDERGALPPRAGRTADELAAEAALALPAEAAELAAAARLFDDVRYGDRAGTAAGYRRIRDLDGRIQAARSGPAATVTPASAAAGPA